MEENLGRPGVWPEIDQQIERGSQGQVARSVPDADEEEADDRQLNGGGNQIGAEDVNWIDRSGARIFDGCKSAHHFVFLVVHAQGVELNHIRVVRAEGLEASGLLKAWQESHADAKVIVSRGVHAFVVRANQLVVVVAEAGAGQGLRELG